VPELGRGSDNVAWFILTSFWLFCATSLASYSAVLCPENENVCGERSYRSGEGRSDSGETSTKDSEGGTARVAGQMSQRLIR